jgi:hypothetical protein
VCHSNDGCCGASDGTTEGCGRGSYLVCDRARWRAPWTIIDPDGPKSEVDPLAPRHPTTFQQHIPSPSHSAAANRVESSVGGGAAAAAPAVSSAPSVLDAALPAVTQDAIQTNDAAAHQNASALAAWTTHAQSTHCLIADVSLAAASSDADRIQLLAAAADSLTSQQRMESVQKWLQACFVQTLRVVPFLVRSGALSNH